MMNEAVSVLMSKNLITVGPGDTLDKVKDIFVNNKIHHLPVVEGEKLVAAFIIDISKRKQLEEELRNQTVNLEKLVGERTRELEHLNLGLQTQVHERKMAEAALIQSQEQLKSMLNQERELNVLKTRFVSMASHEFRTPLSTILSSISLVERYSESEHFEKRDKHVKRIKKSVKQLTDILDDFL